jgi:TonB family protein
LQREQVVAAAAPGAGTSTVSTAPAAPQVTAKSVTPEPVVRAAFPPATPSRIAAARTTQAQPDPLAPRYTNASQRATRASATRTHRYGAPIDNTLPTAGTALPQRPADSAAQEPVIAPVIAPVAAAGVVAADEFDRVVARDPVYPLAALRNKTRGWVELEFTILPNGTVRDVAVVGAEPTGVFEAAASGALAQWQFRPRLVNGHPVAQRSRITLRFDVEG